MSTTTPTKKLMTAEEFGDWVHQPEQANKWFESVRGKVIELPPPNKPHGFVCINVGRILGNFTFELGKSYLTSNDSGVVLERDPDTVPAPDVAFYEDASTFSELHPKYGEVPPRLAIEVLSPSDRLGKVMRKIMDYLRNGVELVWLLDPETRNVTVHRPGKEPYVVQEN